MKKISILIYLCCFSFCVIAQAQPAKQKAEAAFVRQLTYILKGSTEQHWAYKGKMTIDSAFKINKEGILSVSVHYKDEEGNVVRTRMATPVKNIHHVAYDLYIILDCVDDEVSSFESDPNKEELKELDKTNYFHIGVPKGDGYYEQERLQKLLDNLLKYYPK